MIINSQFIPATGLTNPHLQTLVPYLMRRKLSFKGIKQSFDLPDGDVLDLVWTEKPDTYDTPLNATSPHKPIVIIFHGLEGSIESHYAKGMMLVIKKKGWIGLFMHFRSCAKNMNRRANLYHSGETGDAKAILNWLKLSYPQSSLAAIGFSLGGNMLLKLVAELGENSPLSAVVSVSAPLVLQQSAVRLNKGFSRLYQMHLLGLLKQKLIQKFEQHDYQQLIGFQLKNMNKIKTIRDFDDWITAPLYGFESAEDYYQQCSSRQFLSAIKMPVLIIQAYDDPFMGSKMLPHITELSPDVQLELSQAGGHVGFIGGSILRPYYWLERRVPDYLSAFI